jgi:Tfp pilus assembly protein PilF
VVPRGLERVQLDPDGSAGLHASVIVAASAQRDQRELAAFHLERGRRLFDRELDGEALTELRRSIYLSPYETQAHLLIGRIYLRAGRPGDAIDALKISIWSADSVPAHVALAEAYLKTGDAKRARAEAERALIMDPASNEARRLLGQMR